MWLVYFYYQPTINWCFGLAALNCGLDQIIFIQIYEVVIDCFKQLTPFIKHWVRYIGMHQTTMIYLLVIFLIGGFNHFLFSTFFKSYYIYIIIFGMMTPKNYCSGGNCIETTHPSSLFQIHRNHHKKWHDFVAGRCTPERGRLWSSP